MAKWTEEELETAYSLRAEGLSSAQIGKRLGRTADSVEGRLKPCSNKGVKKSQSVSPVRTRYMSEDETSPTTELLPRIVGSGDKIEAESRIEGITTLEELIAACQIDLNVWDVERWVANTWPVGTRTEDASGQARIVTKNLYQVKAWLKKKPVTLKKIEEIFESCVQQKVNMNPIIKKSKAPVMLEISIPDLHLGKLAWGEETGHDNYDSDEAILRFKCAVNDFLTRINPDHVESILFPIGNDFFNVDGFENNTSAGTPQNEDGRWQKSFQRGCELATWALDRCSGIAPSKALIVPGNHDMERSFYLGSFLNAYYRNNVNVEIDNAPNPRKYHRYGKTLLGFAHGDRVKLKDLSRIAQVEQRQAWGESKYCEWHLGHLHRESSMEEGGVIARVIPSLTPPDAWHSKSGYVTSIPCAQAFVYDKEMGLDAILYHRA